MADFAKELEQSYRLMGDGEHNTDELLAWEHAQELMQSQENIIVTVSGVTRGGVTADFEGISAFIPASRLGLDRVEDVSVFLNQEIVVRVAEADIESNKLVLSAREYLRELSREEKSRKIREVVPGAVFAGTVSTIKEYGAFIDLENGLSGLVHISQISHTKIKHPKVVLKEGQEVNVKVLEVKDGKLSLSIKALTEDPNKEEEAEIDYELPQTESIGTSMGDLFKNIKLK